MTSQVIINSNSVQVKPKINPYVKCELALYEKIRQSDLSIHAIAIHQILCLTVFKNSNFTEISISALMSCCKCSKNTVIKALKELEKNKFIIMNKMTGRKTFYQMTYAFNGQIEKKKTFEESKKETHYNKNLQQSGSCDEPLLDQTGSSGEPIQACINNSITNQKKTPSKKSRRAKQVKTGGDKSFINLKKSKSIPGKPFTKEFIHKSEYVFECWELCRKIIEYSQKLGKIGEIKCMNKYLESMYRSKERVGWEYAENELKRLIQEWDEFKKKEKIIWVEDVTKTSREDKSPEDIETETHNQKVLELLHQTGHYETLKRNVIAKSKTPQFLKGRFLDMEIIQEYENSKYAKRIGDGDA